MREIEPGAGVVLEYRRVGWAVAFVARVEMLGAEGAEVQIDAGRAGSAVEGEGHRAVVAFDRVGGDDDVASNFAILVARGQGADGHGVLQRLSAELDGLLRVGFGRQGRQCSFVGRGTLVAERGFVSRGGSLVGLRDDADSGTSKTKERGRKDREALGDRLHTENAHLNKIQGPQRTGSHAAG